MLGVLGQNAQVQRKKQDMLELLETTMYLGGNLTLIGMTVLPAVFLLTVSVVYFVAETIHNFRERRGYF